MKNFIVAQVAHYGMRHAVTLSPEEDSRPRDPAKRSVQQTFEEIRKWDEVTLQIVEDQLTAFMPGQHDRHHDHADEKGMISYYLVDPDQDSSKYQKLGEISESKFKNLENMGYIGERNLQQEVNNKIDDKIKLIMVRKIDEVYNICYN